MMKIIVVILMAYGLYYRGLCSISKYIIDGLEKDGKITEAEVERLMHDWKMEIMNGIKGKESK